MYNPGKLSLPGPSDDSHLISVPGPSTGQLIKKDPHERADQVMTMIIDPGNMYGHGQQKMYRLVNVSSEVDINGHPPPHHVMPGGSPPRKKKLLPPTSQHLPQRAQLADEILIDELGDTIVIEQGIVRRR